MKKTNKQDSNKITRACAWAQCPGEGEYPAPKTPENPQDRYYFCLEHVREYNKSWNFFREMNMDMQQIDNFQKDNLTGHRPTWKFGVDGFNFNTIEEIQNHLFGSTRSENPNNNRNNQKNNASLPKPTRDALNALGLSYPVTMQQIKKSYKKLAKEYHPDLNGDANDEKIKNLNQAYSYLKSLDIFK